MIKFFLLHNLRLLTSNTIYRNITKTEMNEFFFTVYKKHLSNLIKKMKNVSYFNNTYNIDRRDFHNLCINIIMIY